MSKRDLVIRLLGTHGEDMGCERTLALLAEYVEGELAGQEVGELLPAVAEHLRNCPREERVASPSNRPCSPPRGDQARAHRRRRDRDRANQSPHSRAPRQPDTA